MNVRNSTGTQSSGVVSKELLYPNIWMGSRIPCFSLRV
jgi:hypothetical protein